MRNLFSIYSKFSNDPGVHFPWEMTNSLAEIITYRAWFQDAVSFVLFDSNETATDNPCEM
jgi:hypothetical protein